jgi:hypothetical protein
MNDNQSCYFLLKALHFALVEIREEAYSIKNNRIYGLSDLIHNLPLQISAVIDNEEIEQECSILLEKFVEKSKKAGAQRWIENVLNQ